MKVLILGGGLQGLSCGESLHGKGHIIDIVSDNLHITRSKFFRKIYSKGFKSTDDSLFSILKQEKYDVILPMGDLEVSYLSRNKDRIEPFFSCRCATPNKELLGIVEDKNHFMQFCQENDIPHPKTIGINEENLDNASQQIGFPSLIKPDFSVGARGITKVNDIFELKTKYSEVCRTFGSCTLQEFVDNNEYYYNVMLYRSSKGAYPAYAISKIVRMYPVTAGSSSCLITVENDELLCICKDCLNKLNWVGMADFDVLQRRDNGEYKIIEINPRVPASLRAAAVSGVNFPELIILDAVGQIIPHYFYEPGKTLRYLGIDIMWLMKSNNRFHTKPNWMKLVGKDIYYQDIYASDPSSWWTWLAEGLKKLRRRNTRIR